MTQPNHPETPWHLVILLPNATSRSIGRYHNRQEAESSLRTLRRLAPNANYTIIFVPPHEPGEPDDIES